MWHGFLPGGIKPGGELDLPGFTFLINDTLKIIGYCSGESRSA